MADHYFVEIEDHGGNMSNEYLVARAAEEAGPALFKRIMRAGRHVVGIRYDQVEGRADPWSREPPPKLVHEFTVDITPTRTEYYIHRETSLDNERRPHHTRRLIYERHGEEAKLMHVERLTPQPKIVEKIVRMPPPTVGQRLAAWWGEMTSDVVYDGPRG